jgi:hypothetical protein
MTEQEKVPAEAPGGGAFGPLVGALVAPGEAFGRLAVRPRSLVALLLLVALGIGFAYVGMTRVPAEDFLRAIEEQGREVPPKLREDPEGFARTMRVPQLAAGTIFSALFYVAAAGIFLVLFRLLGSDLTYRQSLATTVHGMLPLGVSALLGIVVVLGRERITLEELQSGSVLLSHLGFLAGEEAGKLTRAALASLDLFSAWAVALLAIGYRVVARVSKGVAWGVVGALWGAGIGLKLALMAIF